MALAVAGVIGGSLLVKNRPWARDAMILSPRTKSTSSEDKSVVHGGILISCLAIYNNENAQLIYHML